MTQGPSYLYVTCIFMQIGKNQQPVFKYKRGASKKYLKKKQLSVKLVTSRVFFL